MSITFDVYPLTAEIPTFQQVSDLATKKINSFLTSYEIEFTAKLNLVSISKQEEVKKQNEVDLNSLAIWNNESEYIWFNVNLFKGGIDVYSWELDEREKSDYMEEVLDSVDFNERFEDKKVQRRELVERCFENKRQWHIKRWANQAWITSVAFGFIASSFAELTDGIIYSVDGGWDYQIFPATSEEFDAVYFRPEKTLSEDTRKAIEDFKEEILFEIENI